MNSARDAAATARRAAPGSRTLRGLLERTDTFLHLVEMVTSRGLLTDRAGKRVLSLARNLVEHKDIHALSITDNPGGNAMFGADALGTDLISRGQEVVIHLSCKDWNRNALESRGWQLASLGLRQHPRPLGRLSGERLPGPGEPGVRHRFGRACCACSRT